MERRNTSRSFHRSITAFSRDKKSRSVETFLIMAYILPVALASVGNPPKRRGFFAQKNRAPHWDEALSRYHPNWRNAPARQGRAAPARCIGRTRTRLLRSARRSEPMRAQLAPTGLTPSPARWRRGCAVRGFPHRGISIRLYYNRCARKSKPPPRHLTRF